MLARGRLFDYYPDEGPLRRELYPKHIAFLQAGASRRVRMMMAANRVGKTEGAGLFEVALHMTGLYPDWWRGRRFDRGVRVWVCGDTGKTIREILQPKLLGAWGNFGTGLLPSDSLLKTTSKQGVAEAVDTFTVKHVSGAESHGVFKSYDQGRIAFQGSEQDVVLLDEECSLDVYSECVMRTMTTAGLIMLTFTPLSGVTRLIKHMRDSGAFEVGATWDDVPHLSANEKEELWAATPEHMREARAKGIPARGSGVVYDVSESTLLVKPFVPPWHWAFICGIDFGGGDHPTAAVKLAHDRDLDMLYVCGAVREKQSIPVLFAENIKAWGSWCPWSWPHDGLQKNKDPQAGRELYKLYAEHDMNMLPEPASFSDEKLLNSVEAGVAGIREAMVSGRFKVMDHLEDWLAEFRDYHRVDGIIHKVEDDLMDATRYAWMMRRHARIKPNAERRANTRVSWRTV